MRRRQLNPEEALGGEHGSDFNSDSEGDVGDSHERHGRGFRGAGTMLIGCGAALLVLLLILVGWLVADDVLKQWRSSELDTPDARGRWSKELALEIKSIAAGENTVCSSAVLVGGKHNLVAITTAESRAFVEAWEYVSDLDPERLADRLYATRLLRSKTLADGKRWENGLVQEEGAWATCMESMFSGNGSARPLLPRMAHVEFGEHPFVSPAVWVSTHRAGVSIVGGSFWGQSHEVLFPLSRAVVKPFERPESWIQQHPQGLLASPCLSAVLSRTSGWMDHTHAFAVAPVPQEPDTVDVRTKLRFAASQSSLEPRAHLDQQLTELSLAAGRDYDGQESDQVLGRAWTLEVGKELDQGMQAVEQSDEEWWRMLHNVSVTGRRRLEELSSSSSSWSGWLRGRLHRFESAAASLAASVSGTIDPIALQNAVEVLDEMRAGPGAEGESRCTVWSFGINDDWSFELFMRALGCQVTAFDPSIHRRQAAAFARAAGIRYFPWGLGGKDRLESVHSSLSEQVAKAIESKVTDQFPQGVRDVKENRIPDSWTIRSLPSLLRDDRFSGTGHTARVDVLKIDCEGCEWDAIQACFDAGPWCLRSFRQIAAEVHNMPDDRSRQSNLRVSGALMAQRATILRRMRDEAGFHGVALHENPLGGFVDSGSKTPCCYEALWLRMGE
jgi:hypothetical protein